MTSLPVRSEHCLLYLVARLLVLISVTYDLIQGTETVWIHVLCIVLIRIGTHPTVVLLT